MQRNTKYRTLIWIFCSTTLALSSQASALKSDRQKDMTIAADRAEFHKLENKSTFAGHVEFKQGTTRIRGDKAVIYTDKHNKIALANIEGHPARFETQPEVGKPLMHAQARRIEYDATTHLLKLIGRAKAYQQNERFESPEIQYNLQTQTLITPGTHGRTVIVLHPRKNT